MESYKIIIIGAIVMIISGTLLSEPTWLGRWHPLIGDGMLMLAISWIVRKQGE